MRILQVCSYLYPALTYGGPAKMVYDLSVELSKKNSVTIYTTDVWDEKRRIVKSEKIKPTKQFSVQYFPNVFNSLAFKLRLFTGFGMCFDFVKNHAKYDVVHIHDVFIIPQLLLCLYAFYVNKPVFMSPHGVLDPTRLQKKTILKRILFPIVYYCLNNSKQVIAVSNKEAADLKSFGLTNVSTVYNGIAPLRVVPSKKYGKFQKSNLLTLLYIGKIHPQKGIKEVLLALHKSQLKAQFLIAGPDDGGKKELDEIIERLSMDTIYFLGYVDDRDKKSLYQISDLFVHPSYAEGFSISVLEALQAGVPVIISDGCNFPEVEKYKVGYIVSVDSLVSDLSKLFIKVNNEKNNLRQYGTNAANLIKKQYTVSIMVSKISKIYEKSI